MGKLNTRADHGVATPTALPDWMREDASLGNENVSRGDVNIPRLTVLQALSPELNPSEVTKYIEGAKVGQILNTLTRETFGALKLVNCYFEKQFAVFRRRNDGGGFRGVYATQAEAVSAVEHPARPDDDGKLEITEQDVHYVLLLNEANQIAGEAALVMTSTKFKVSRNWNSFIAMQKGPRFGGVWELSTVSEKNAKGSFFNYRVAPAGWVSPEVYAAAKEFYEAVSTGTKKVTQDREEEHVADDVRY